jgi:hypothetical protein
MGGQNKVHHRASGLRGTYELRRVENVLTTVRGRTRELSAGGEVEKLVFGLSRRLTKKFIRLLEIRLSS